MIVSTIFILYQLNKAMIRGRNRNRGTDEDSDLLPVGYIDGECTSRGTVEIQS